MKQNVKRRYSCHELFGFDVMLDENLKPWIIEVNISPRLARTSQNCARYKCIYYILAVVFSLHSNSQLDVNIKGGMIKDLLNLAGYMIPDKHDVKDMIGHEPSYVIIAHIRFQIAR